MKDNQFTCCICGGTFNGFGNNPDGACWRDPNTAQVVMGEFKETDRCCDSCDNMFVIPGRIFRLQMARKKTEAD